MIVKCLLLHLNISLIKYTLLDISVFLSIRDKDHDVYNFVRNLLPF